MITPRGSEEAQWADWAGLLLVDFDVAPQHRGSGRANGQLATSRTGHSRKPPDKDGTGEKGTKLRLAVLGASVAAVVNAVKHGVIAATAESAATASGEVRCSCRELPAASPTLRLRLALRSAAFVATRAVAVAA